MPQTKCCSITGMGVLSPIGVGVDAFWQSLQAGRTAIAPLRAFSTEAFSRHLGAELPEGWEGLLSEAEQGLDPCAAYALIAAREAWDQAGLTEAAIAPDRIAVVLGTNLGNLLSMALDDEGQAYRLPLTIEQWRGRGAYTQTAALARALGAKGPMGTIVTACAASTNALGYARDLLMAGEADVVLAGGADVMALELFSGFFALGAISPAPCAPFSEPYGMTIGEGAGFVVLEREEHAAQRNATSFGSLLGYGLSSDGHHVTTPDPLGRGVERSLTAALRDAGVSPADVDLVNAHGTGTEANDAAEWQGICRALGERANEIPVNSVKGYFGHPQGAAGIMELIATILAMGKELVLPTLNSSTLRPHCPVDPVHEERPRPASVRCVLKNSSAFGGANASVVVGTPAATRGASLDREEDIVIVSTGLVGAHGDGSLHEALKKERGWLTWREAEKGPAGWVGEVPRRALGRWSRHPAMRDLDPSAMFLTAAVSSALQQTGLRLKGSLQEETGLVVGVSGHDPLSAALFAKSLIERGPAQASATAFAHSVPNAAAGTTASVLSLKGVHSVLSGPHSGLWAVVYAARMLAMRPEVSFLVAGGVDELNDEWIEAAAEGFAPSALESPPVGAVDRTPSRYTPPGEGAACLVLARRATAEAHQLPILATLASTWTAGPAQEQAPGRLASWLAGRKVDGVYSGAGFAKVSRELAGLHHLDKTLPHVPRFGPAPLLGEAVAAGAVSALVGAVEALHTGQRHSYPGEETDPTSTPNTLLTFAEDPAIGSCAVLVEQDRR